MLSGTQQGGYLYIFPENFSATSCRFWFLPRERCCPELHTHTHTRKDTRLVYSNMGGGVIVMISLANVCILWGKIILLVWLPFMSAAWLRDGLRHRCWWNPSGSNLGKGTIREIVLSLALQRDRRSHRIDPLALHQWLIGYIFRDATSCSRLVPGARLAARMVKTIE